MKRRYLNTLGALVVLALLWASFTFYEKRKSQAPAASSSSKSKPEEKLFPLDGKHVQSFGLQPKDAAPILCRREATVWQIVEPQKLSADQSTVSALLNTLTSLTVDQVVDAHPAALKDCGLDNPSEIIQVATDAQPAEFVLMLGDDTPTGSGVYAQVRGNPRVVTLASYQKTALAKTLFVLRDKRAVTLDAGQLQKIEVHSSGKSFILVKNPEGVWELLLPPAVRADLYTVDNLVSQLRGLSMQSVVAEDKKTAAQFGFASPALTLKLVSPSGSQTLTLGKKDGDKYDAMNSALAPVFTLNTDVLTQFQKTPGDLRDKALFSFSTFDVIRLEVQTPQGHWTFEKQKNRWKEIAPAAKDIASDKVESLLEQAHDLRADSFPTGQPTNLAAFGLAKPSYHLEVQWSGKKEIVEASKVGDHVYARRSTDPLPSELPKTAFDALEKSLSGLK